MNEIDAFIAQFKQKGYKITPQRRTILATLCTPDTHLTADQIGEQVRKMMPDVSIATIYNTLHELVSAGVVRELDLGWGKRCYELARPIHAHRICTRCNSVYDVDLDWDRLVQLVQVGDGFVPLAYQVVVQGYCAGCRADTTNQN